MLNKRDYYEKIKDVDFILSGKGNKREIKRYSDDERTLEYFFKHVNGWDWYLILKELGMMEPHSSPRTYKSDKDGSYIIPEWIILSFLERLSSQLGTANNDLYEKELICFIREATILTDDKKAKTDNYKTWRYFIRILNNISNKSVTDEIIDLVPIWLESQFDVTVQGTEIIDKLIPKFLNNKADEADIRKAEKLFDYITDVKVVAFNEKKAEILGETEEYKFKIDMYWLEKCFEENYKLLAQLCTPGLIDKYVNKIRPILKKQETGAYLSFYSEGSLHEPPDMFRQILINILNKKAQFAHEKISNTLSSFLSDDRYFFQKIALYIMAENEPSFKELIWKNIDNIIGTSYYRLLFVGDELKHLLERLGKLPVRRRNILEKAINRGLDVEGPADKGRKRKEKIAIWKQRLYKALSYDPFFKKRHDLIKKETGIDTQLSAGIVKLESHWGAEKSPLGEDDILRKSNEELADYLAQFKTRDRWEGPTVDGLSDILKGLVENNHEKFTSNLFPFLKVGYLYIYDILWGLRDAWKGKKEIDWGKILDFLATYIEQPGFWTDKLKVQGSSWNADHKWVIKQIGDLLQEGSKEGWAFNDIYLDKAEAIIIRILERTEAAEEKDSSETSDPVNYALNSAAGNIIVAYLFLLLRKSKTRNKAGAPAESRWAEEEKTIYGSLIYKKIAEAYTILGQYLTNFNYLDAEYINELIPNLLKEEDQLWLCFWTGYLYSERIYIDFFVKLYGHYDRALNTVFHNKIAEERLIQHIAVAYLWPKELREAEELINKILILEKSSHLDALTSFFRGQYHREKGKKADSAKKVEVNLNERARIIRIWKQVYERYRDVTRISEEQRHVLTLMLRLIVLLPEINQEYSRWINLSIANMTGQLNPHLLISDLISMKDRINNIISGKTVINILEKIVEQELPFYLISGMTPLVEELYGIDETEIKEAADGLCNMVAEKGIYDSNGQLFLRNIYDKYNR